METRKRSTINQHNFAAILSPKMLLTGVMMVLACLSYAQETNDERGMISSNEPKVQKEKKNKSSDIKTIFGNNNTVHGGYGGASCYFTELNGKGALLVGGRGGWIINHSLSIGLGGYGIANNVKFNDIVVDEEVILEGGYGGLYIEAIVLPKQPVHISFPLLIGAGGVAYSIDRTPPEINRDPDDVERNFLNVDDDAFFVIEPGIELEMNVLRNFRIAFGASYRHISDLSLIETKSDDLDGVSAGVTLKFGKF